MKNRCPRCERCFEDIKDYIAHIEPCKRAHAKIAIPQARPEKPQRRVKAHWNENGFLVIDLSDQKEAREELQELLSKLRKPK